MQYASRIIEPSVIAKAKNIKLIVSDIDGVLTDGGLYFTEDGGEAFAKFNIYDGFAVVIAHNCDLKIAIISGRTSLCTEARFKKLGVTEVHTGILNKLEKLNEIKARLQLDYTEIAFIGDDLIDLSSMLKSGLAIAPDTAVNEIKLIANYITSTTGGNGVLREVVELILKAQIKYTNYVNSFNVD